MQAFLSSSTYIDFLHPAVMARAQQLALGCRSQEDIARSCFEFVRDHIRHSWDYQLNPVTCKASEVLEHGTGYCYAKSHLLAALLRANRIPAALCYQRLTITEQPPYCLHGLNAVYLPVYGWYKLDARGNKANIHAEFCPPLEKLAFPLITHGELHYPDFYAEPHPAVLHVLTTCDTVQQVYQNLPDIGEITAP